MSTISCFAVFGGRWVGWVSRDIKIYVKENK